MEKSYSPIVVGSWPLAFSSWLIAKQLFDWPSGDDSKFPTRVVWERRGLKSSGRRSLRRIWRTRETKLRAKSQELTAAFPPFIPSSQRHYILKSHLLQ